MDDTRLFGRHVLRAKEMIRETGAQFAGWRWCRCHPRILHRWPHAPSVPSYALYLGTSSLPLAVEAVFHGIVTDSLSVRENESASLWSGYSPQQRGYLLPA